MAPLNLFSLYIFFIFFISTQGSTTLTESESPASLSSSASSDVELLLGKIKASLQGNSENLLLSSWNSTVPMCQWRGLKWVFSNGTPLLCTDLSSPQSTNLSLFKDPSLHLLSLQLPSANLTGSLPRELGEFSMLQSLYVNINSLSGTVPLELGYSSSLSDIDLGYNMLSGSLPPSIWNLCDKLVSLRLHANSLSGSVPELALPNSTCKNLQVLDLGKNKLSGTFPEFITRFLGLRELDLGDNVLSGSIPESLAALNIEKLNLSHNNFSGVLPVFGESKYSREVFEGNNPGLCGLPLKSCTGSSGLSPGAIAGIVIGKLILFQGGEHLTLEDVLNATGQVMEKTNYGTIYKAKLADGGTIALRLLREGSCKDGSSCLPVIRQLGKIRNENLIPLRAFYQGKRGEKLLIYDYLPHRNLHDLLYETRAGRPVLNWARRHKIALGIARGLAFLHTGLEAPITHGNVRSKNVLVDEFFVARLTEFGLDKLMIPAVADEMVALAKTDGYKAPELQKMKKCNSRTDVYAYGILLLEILIGKKPGKNGRSGEFVDLPSMVKVAVLEETTMEVFDVEVLKGIRSPMEEGLVQALKLAMGCCAPVASVRPTMEEVVKQLEENRPRNRSALYSPTETRSEIGGEHLTLEDVLNATGQVMEKTNYGTIYKAKLADGGTIALRLLREGSCKDGSSCLPVIRQLGKIRNENLIPLRAFYQGKRGEKLLIYDYLPHRNLHDLLYETRAGRPVLNWARRHKIALGIARGLAFLHTGLEAPITHGNVRSKNVLVDEFFVARLTEFGLDKLMIPAVADEMVALAKTDGYKAPELQKMKKCNSRTDVYAYGILLLEILIGKKPGKNGRSGEFVDLPSMVKVAVLEETTMEVFDVEVLKGIRSPMEEGLVQALKLAMGCCAPVASVRPTMEEVVKQLEENRPRNRSALYSPTETRSEIGTPF
nr:putative kinase-like protein tmkl1 [Quercus suber]